MRSWLLQSRHMSRVLFGMCYWQDRVGARPHGGHRQASAAPSACGTGAQYDSCRRHFICSTAQKTDAATGEHVDPLDVIRESCVTGNLWTWWSSGAKHALFCAGDTSAERCETCFNAGIGRIDGHLVLDQIATEALPQDREDRSTDGEIRRSGDHSIFPTGLTQDPFQPSKQCRCPQRRDDR